eukprot:TRINITY_DN17283_c0_g1_i1.p1 TRINITY_DN17283_c0_g1~~TRINITY_DN17283_c0_g1_i1.p1  ORF type:complete len:298 (+),score=83.05 TRINITY_DN17283_c0_g1_i1:72-965(+)
MRRSASAAMAEALKKDASSAGRPASRPGRASRPATAQARSMAGSRDPTALLSRPSSAASNIDTRRTGILRPASAPSSLPSRSSSQPQLRPSSASETSSYRSKSTMVEVFLTEQLSRISQAKDKTHRRYRAMAEDIDNESKHRGLRERCVSGNVSASSDPEGIGAPARKVSAEELRVYADAFDAIIKHNPVYAEVLQAVKEVYDASVAPWQPLLPEQLPQPAAAAAAAEAPERSVQAAPGVLAELERENRRLKDCAGRLHRQRLQRLQEGDEGEPQHSEFLPYSAMRVTATGVRAEVF